LSNQFLADPLARHLAQQPAERANIAQKQGFFPFAGLRLKLRQSLGPGV
jgi:hypothetical protein